MEVVQVIPKDDYKVIVYFVDGAIKRCDVSSLVGKGVFACLSDREFYEKNCTVLNGTLAWTLDGTYNKYNCIDVDPFVLYEEGESIPDPLMTA